MNKEVAVCQQRAFEMMFQKFIDHYKDGMSEPDSTYLLGGIPTTKYKELKKMYGAI